MWSRGCLASVAEPVGVGSVEVLSGFHCVFIRVTCVSSGLAPAEGFALSAAGSLSFKEVKLHF